MFRSGGDVKEQTKEMKTGAKWRNVQTFGGLKYRCVAVKM